MLVAEGKEGGVGQERVAHTFLPLTPRAMLGSHPVFADRSVQAVCKQCARKTEVCKRCASSVQGVCKEDRSVQAAPREGVGRPIPPLAEAGPIWRASPPSLVLQLTHRLAATTAYQYTVLGGGELWAGTSHTPRLPLGVIKRP